MSNIFVTFSWEELVALRLPANVNRNTKVWLFNQIKPKGLGQWMDGEWGGFQTKIVPH